MSEFEECIVDDSLDEIKNILVKCNILTMLTDKKKDGKIWIQHPFNPQYDLSVDGDILDTLTNNIVTDLTLYKDIWLTVPPHFIMYIAMKYSYQVAARIYKLGILIEDKGVRKYKHPHKSDILFDGFYKWDDIGDETAPDRWCYRLNLTNDAGFKFMSLTWLDRYIHDLRKIYNVGVSKYSV